MAAKLPDQEEESDFILQARKIDSEVGEKLKDTLELIELYDILSDIDYFAGGNFIPVGSCIDGSKVNIPGDNGDIDILIVSNEIVLKENLFVYDNRFPAFLYVRTDGEHSKYFHDTKQLIDGKYLPVSVLKQLHEKFFGSARGLVKRMTAQGISKERDTFNVTRNSSVGLEKSRLDLGTFLSLGVEDISQNFDFNLSRMGKFGQQALNMFGFNAIETKASNSECSSDLDSLYSMSKSCFEQFEQAINIVATEDQIDENHEKTQNKHFEQSVECEKQTGNEYVSSLDRISKSLKYSNNDFQNDFDSESEMVDTFSAKHKKKNDVPGNAKPHDVKEIPFHRFSSVDFVPAFRFKQWPRTAEEWIYRKRMWPSKRTMKEILDARCQVVAKRPFALSSGDNTGEGDNDPYFRLSFALSEIILAKTLPEQQKICWRVLKAYQKAYLGTNPRVLTSYHWKNALFWISEETDPLFWSDGNVIEGVRRSLDFVITCLQQKFFPFYFVKKMNLLNGCNENAINETCKRVKTIKNKPLEFLKTFFKFQYTPENIAVNSDTIEKIMSRKHAAQQFDSATEDMFTTIHKCNEPENYVNHCRMLNLEKNKKVLNRLARKAKQQLKQNLENNVDSDELKSKRMKMLEAIEHLDFKNLEHTSDAFFESATELSNHVSPPESSLENKPEHIKKSFLSVSKHGPKVFASFSSLFKGDIDMPTFTETILDSFENISEATKVLWSDEIDKEDGKAKEKVNTLKLLLDKYSSLLPQVRHHMTKPRMFTQRDKKADKIEIEIELD